MNYFRHAHLPESADDGQDLFVVRTPEPWDCTVCQETITDGRTTCWNCSAERGDWVCPCGRKNRKGDDACSDCGEERPDED